jgi:hypothetical protein
MSSTLSSIESRSAHLGRPRSSLSGAIVRPRDAGDERQFQPPAPGPVQKRRVDARSLIAFCIGVAATFAWQSYGSSLWLGWLAPPAEPVVEVSTVPSSYQEELKAISFGLAEVRERVDQIAAQLAAGQEQMTRDITNKLEAAKQDVVDKITPALPPRPAAAPARSAR